MKLYSSLLLLFLFNQIHAQSIKYKFTLPKRESRKYDTIAVRPYTFIGTYKNGEISFSVDYEKDSPNAVDYSLLNPKANSLRQVSFQFEFFDSTGKLILNQTTRFVIELIDGHAIAPGTEIFRASYKIPEPNRVNFIWSFYDQPGLIKIQTAKICSSSFMIDLFERSKDYSSNNAQVTTAWGPAWSFQ